MEASISGLSSMSILSFAKKFFLARELSDMYFDVCSKRVRFLFGVEVASGIFFFLFTSSLIEFAESGTIVSL